MPLSLEQIRFVEDYLIRNGVKFWDLRMELLDHICSSLEAKMKLGISFQEGLLQIHEAFGNKATVPRLNVDNTKWITSPCLYADHSGYMQLVQEKRSNLQRAYVKAIGKQILHLPQKPEFWFFVVLSGLLWYYFPVDAIPQTTFKRRVLLPIYGLMMLQFVVGGINFFTSYRSLTIQAAWLAGVSNFTYFNMLVYIPKLYLSGSDGSLSNNYLLAVTLIMVVVMWSSLAVFWKTLKKYKGIQSKYYGNR